MISIASDREPQGPDLHDDTATASI